MSGRWRAQLDIGHSVLSAAEGAPWPLLRKPYGPEQLARMIAEVAVSA